jgi:Ca-activated chloride channel family protein
VRLSLVGPLPVDDGEVTFRFPLVVAPRYMPGAALGGEQAGLGEAADTSLVPDASRISPPVLLPGCPNRVRLGLRVAIEDHGARDVASSLHAVTTAHRDAHVVEVHPGERLDRDFILRWRVDGAALRSTLVCADDAEGRGGTFQLTLVPPSTAAVAAKPRDVVFVIDRSGSMGGWKMVAARRAAARMIDTLTSRDRFCVIAFDNAVDFLPGQGLVDASDRNRYRAVEELAKVEARGGTEMMQPLQRAASFLAGGHDDRERVIVLVTDGQVGNEDHILRELAPYLHKTRMFALGIDQSVNAAFLRRLAGAGGGLCELVESEDRLDAVMAKVHRRIGTPIATELRLYGAGLDIEMGTVAPGKLPDVYAGAPVTVFGRYRGSAANAEIELAGTTFGDPLRMRIAREAGAPAERDAARWLHASWARARIRDLEDRYAAGERGSLEHEIVAVSKRYSVLSRFTAFLAVDRNQIVNPGGWHHQVVQPVESPAGWGGGLGQAQSAPPPPANYAARRPAVAMPSNAPAPRPAPPTPGYAAARPAPMAPGERPPRPTEAAPVSAAYPGRAMKAEEAPMGPPPASGAPMGPPPMVGGYGGGAPPIAQPEGAAYARQSSAPADRKLDAGAARPASPTPPPARHAPERERSVAPPVGGGSAYLIALSRLAAELDAQGRGRADAAAIRVLRQRLTEWVEDVRSVGGQDALADAVERLVQRLSAALAAGTALASEAVAIATELAAYAAGGTPPSAPKQGRAFWK